MNRHPVDKQGRVLPEPGWPADRAAPGELELVRRFANSVNYENGADRFSTAEGFDRWLVAEGRSATKPSPDDLAAVSAFRSALHEITVANREGGDTTRAWAALADRLSSISFTLTPDDRGLRLSPQGPTPTMTLLGELALIAIDAGNAGTLQRLKSCTHCQWTIYDTSKNRSARWCSMTACGGRHNARAYRQRKRKRS